MPIANGRRAVQTAGKRQRLVDDPNWPGMVALVDVEAASGNLGIVCIGSENVVAALNQCNTLELSAGQILTFQNVNLYDLWIDVRIDGNAVKWLQRA